MIRKYIAALALLAAVAVTPVTIQAAKAATMLLAKPYRIHVKTNQPTNHFEIVERCPRVRSQLVFNAAAGGTFSNSNSRREYTQRKT